MYLELFGEFLKGYLRFEYRIVIPMLSSCHLITPFLDVADFHFGKIITYLPVQFPESASAKV